jgi:hypothetical protein
MDLLDRYLQAVKKHLPWQRQDDILAELRANLESQLEDREAEMGRPLTAGEVEAWLKQIGPPMQVAARYQLQQYLIGPAVFPTYWYVMRMALLWAFIVYSIVSAVQIFAAEFPSWSAVLDAMLHVPFVLMTTAAWITLVFAALEFVVTHYPEMWPATAGHFADWSPGGLPPFTKDAASGKKPRSYALAVAEVIFGFLFLGWLLLIPQHPYLMMGPGAVYLQISPFQLAPVWVQFYWWVVALNVLQLGWRCLDLWRGSWQRRRPVQQIAMKVCGLIPLIVLIAAPDHQFVTLRHPALDQTRYGGTVDTINYGIQHALLIICAIIVLQMVWEMGRMGLDAYRKRVAAMPTKS